MTASAPQSIRLDKWLWHARFFKTRSLAARIIRDGKVRLDGVRVAKPSAIVRPGAVLTFTIGDRVRVARILECGLRRGPAPEAQALYEDLSPPPPRPKPRAPAPDKAPDKRARREHIALKERSSFDE